MFKDRKSLKEELEKDRKYDSYFDEYKRMIHFGKSIKTRVTNKDNDVFNYALEAIFKDIGLKIEIKELVPDIVLDVNKTKIHITEYKKDNHITLEQKDGKGNLKRLSLSNEQTLFKTKFSNINFYSMIKADRTLTGLQDQLMKYMTKKREKIRAANLGMKLATHFKVEPEYWIKKYAQTNK